ncbi:hypothetical protein H0H92_013866 [Tricholoma furcatifolium]|nr:hypothetical protein H0H92_013866 [Tricholoma furcatifolium]
MRFEVLLSLSASVVLNLASPAHAIVEGQVFNRIVSIWLENTDYTTAAADPNLSALAKKGLTLTNYYALTHPSQPNYVGSVGGDYLGLNSDNTVYVPSNVSTVVDILEDKGITWAEYEQDMPSTGYTGSTTNAEGANDYMRKHNPLISYNSVNTNTSRLDNIKSFTLFESDLAAGNLPQWIFITPNMTNDGHDTSVTFAGTWLNGWLTPLLSNSNFNDNKTLILVTFDETGTDSIANRVFTFILGGGLPSSLVGTSDSNVYTHYSTIATVEANWNTHTLGRYDVGANVFSFVASVTGDEVRSTSTSSIEQNESYPGILSSSSWAAQPVPNTTLVMNGRTVLPAIQSQWSSQVACSIYSGQVVPPASPVYPKC